MGTNMKTIAVIGGTGGTGKWAVKGALLKGYKVKLLARNPDKVTKVLSTLFDADTLKTLQENVVVVAGGVMDDAVLDDLLADTEAVLSFLGMVDQKVWVCRPGWSPSSMASRESLLVGEVLQNSSQC